MKILSIGNSFSQDAHRWLHHIAELSGVHMDTVNLYIGGCTLAQHWDNYVQNAVAYDLEINGGTPVRKVSISEALDMDNWDVITLQQASPHSGMPQTYVPALPALADMIRERCPGAQLWFHQIWAYEWGFERPVFLPYNRDQNEMYRRLCDSTELAVKLIGAPLIPTGRVIQYLRENVPEFDYRNGGLSLNRDGFHLSYDYGRFAAAATWLAVLGGKRVSKEVIDSFADLDKCLLEQIADAVEQVLQNNG